MVAIVGIDVVQRRQYGAERTLTALETHDTRHAGKLRGNFCYRCKLESTRSEDAFVSAISLHLERDLHEKAVSGFPTLARAGNSVS